MTLLAAAWARTLDVVFPPRCVGCRSFGSFLCDECVAMTPRSEGQRCVRCWTPGRSESCLVCYAHPAAHRGMRATFAYEGAARAAVLALKYNSVSAMAPTMAASMSRTLIAWSPDVDAIVAVPLAGMRQRLRGYNQASLLARELGALVGMPVDSKLLKRSRNTPPQTQQRDAMARHRNVVDAFSLSGSAVPERVLVIDDVTTTGATLNSCARVLRDGGADKVYCLAFARED